MEPVSAMQAFNQAAELAAKRGTDVVMCLISMGVLVWVLRWVFRTSAARELAMTKIVQDSMAVIAKQIEAIKELNAAVQHLTANVKDGFDRMTDANKMHRADLERLTDKVDGSCKAKG